MNQLLIVVELPRAPTRPEVQSIRGQVHRLAAAVDGRLVSLEILRPVEVGWLARTCKFLRLRPVASEFIAGDPVDASRRRGQS